MADGHPSTPYADYLTYHLQIDNFPNLIKTRSYTWPVGGGGMSVPGPFTASFPVSQAFDGNGATAWVSALVSGPAVLGYDFGSGKTLNTITLNQGFPNYTPQIHFATQVQVLGSNDNANWTNLGTFNTAYGNNTLNLSSPGAYRYYVLRALNLPSGYWAVAEVNASPDPFASGPVIGLNPALPGTISRTVGQPLYLSVSPRDTGTFTYNWYKNGVLLPPVRAGYNDPVYFLNSLQISDAGTYRVDVMRAGRLYASSSTILTVNAGSASPGGEDNFTGGASTRWSGVYGFDAQDSYLTAGSNRLNLIIDKTGSENTQAFYLWDTPMPSGKNWEVQVDAFVAASGFSVTDYFSLRLSVPAPVSPTSSLFSNNGMQVNFDISSSRREIQNVRSIPQDPGWQELPSVPLDASTTTVGLRIVWNASTKTLTSFYKPGGIGDGTGWIQSAVLNLSSLTTTELAYGFMPVLSGIAEPSFAVTSGQAYFDNFRVSVFDSYTWPVGGGGMSVPGPFTASFPAALAFDGNGATAWVSALVSGPAVLGYDFGRGKTLNTITLNQGFPNYTPQIHFATQVQVLGSNDNNVWANLGTFNTVYGNNTLNLTSPGSYRYYVLRALNLPSGYWAVAEVNASTDPFARTIHVTSSGAGSRDGTSWANAFGNLQSAINAVSREGDQVWVARGTYRPTAFADPNVTTDPRSRSFVLKGGAQIYGGFAGTETSLNQRNFTNNPTILSGDFNGNDSSTWPPDFTRNDNAYHVVVTLNQSQSVTLDGLTITGGNANNTTYIQPNNGSAIPAGVKPHGDGSAVIAAWTGITIANCSIERNASSGETGAVLIAGGDPRFGTTYRAAIERTSFTQNFSVGTNSSGGALAISENYIARVADCRFQGNKASEGGALLLSGSSDTRTSPPVVDIVRCVFEGNQGRVEADTDRDGFLNYGNGGAIYADNRALVDIASCVFLNNSIDPNSLTGPKTGDPSFGLPSGHGGAINALQGATVKIANSLFVGNNAMWSGGAIDVARWEGAGNTPGRVEIYFSVFFNNQSRWGGAINNYLGQLTGFGNIFYQNWSIDGSGYVSDVSNSTTLGGTQSTSTLSRTLTTHGNIFANTGSGIVGGNPIFADPARPAGADGIWFTADDGLEITSGSPALSMVTTARPADFADINGDGNITELLPVDAQGLAYAANPPYHAGAYQALAGSVAPQPPGIPGTPIATAGNAQATLSWAGPTDIGGSAINDYVIQFSPNSGLSWTDFNDGVSTMTSATVTGLTNGVGHVFRVAARNAQGTGFYSPASVMLTPSGPPPAPDNLIPTVSSGQVSIAFTQVSNGGSPISSYEFSTNNGIAWIARSPVSTNSPILITGLANGTAYQIRLRALNAAGAGTPSAALSVTPIVPPSIPTGLVATVNTTARTAVLSWMAPTDNGGSEISDYQIQFSVNGTSWTTFSDGVSTAASATVTGLPASTGYFFRVAAINATGTGAYCPALNIISYTFPSGGGGMSVPGPFTASFPAALAFDGNGATAWVSAAGMAQMVLGYDFGSGKTLNTITLNQGFPNYTPQIHFATQVQVLGSNDNANWTDLGTFNTAYGNNTLNLSNPGSYRYYVLRALNLPSGYWAVAEVTASPDPFARTIYVKQGGAGLRNGSSWDNAFANLEEAMRASIRWNDEIIMGTGTYQLNGKTIKVDGTR